MNIKQKYIKNATLAVVMVTAIMLSGCAGYEPVVGSAVGAGTGALIGNQFGGGTGKTLFTIGGAALGGAAGYEVGKSMKKNDAEEKASSGEGTVVTDKQGNKYLLTEKDGKQVLLPIKE